MTARKAKPVLDRDLTGLEGGQPVLEDLPAGRLARDLAEEELGSALPRLPDGRWAVGATSTGLRLFAAGDEDTWLILRAADADESDSGMAASRLHALLGSPHEEWDADR